MSAPGWHPDPGGLWEYRWWDGTAWASAVQTGNQSGEEPYPVTVTPPADRNAPILELTSNTVSAHTERYILTWNALQTFKGRAEAQPPSEVLPLWMVLGIDVWIGAVAWTRGVGDVRLSIGYQGYVGPNTEALRNVTQPDWAKAMILRQRGLAAAHP